MPSQATSIARQALQAVKPYSKGNPPPSLPNQPVLNLDNNEAHYDQSALSQNMLDRSLATYPDKQALERLIAERFEISTDQVLVTCGADDALDRICRAYLEPGRSIVLPEPTFAMLKQYAQVSGAEIRSIPWERKAYPTTEVLDAVESSTSVIAVVSPNNPTGSIASADDLIAVSTTASNAVVLLDHAYVEYAENDLTRLALSLPNVIVVRTFSKAFGLASLRVGYALGPREKIEDLRRVANPYPVSGLSLSLAAQALNQNSLPRDQHVARVKYERARIKNFFNNSGLSVDDSSANFIFLKSTKAEWIYRALLSLGVLVRYFADESAIRITCPGNRSDFDTLLNALQSVINPKAMLFDMDGVLVDVQDSYDECILQTARRFGVQLTSADIEAERAKGSANDDWELTFRLIQRAGGTTTLAEVTKIFEDLYQGNENTPGLKLNETIRVDLQVIKSLSQRFKLGIVTGRPRADALYRLKKANLEDLFETIVCREDAPLKPNPAPVTKALNNLEVEAAWMLGDTVDDLAAARAAGVVPIAIRTASTNQAAVDQFYSEGAGTVLSNPNEIMEML